MSTNSTKFSIGSVVKHRHFDFRGVIYDVDFEFNNSEEWYQSIPKAVRPKKDQPFYIIYSLKVMMLHTKRMYLSRV